MKNTDSLKVGSKVEFIRDLSSYGFPLGFTSIVLRIESKDRVQLECYGGSVHCNNFKLCEPLNLRKFYIYY